MIHLNGKAIAKELSVLDVTIRAKYGTLKRKSWMFCLALKFGEMLESETKGQQLRIGNAVIGHG